MMVSTVFALVDYTFPGIAWAVIIVGHAVHLVLEFFKELFDDHAPNGLDLVIGLDVLLRLDL